MDSEQGPSDLLRRRSASRILLYSLALVFVIQAYAMADDVLSGSIQDPWIAFFPVLWVDIALVVVVILAWGATSGVGGAAEGPGRPSRWRSWLVPDFHTIRRAVGVRSVRLWLVGFGAAYALILMGLQRVIVVDFGGGILPEGTDYPFVGLFGGPLGWGPKLVWAPNPYFGVLLRPYTVAVTFLLAALGGLGVGLVAYRRNLAGRARSRLRDTVGAMTGALVMCPACATSPALALTAGLLAPASGGAGSVSFALGPLAAFSTVMLIASVIMLWVGIARASRALRGLEPSTRPTGGPSAPGHRLGVWLMAASVIVAVGALLLDLSGVPSSGSHGHTAEAAGFAHAPEAIALGVLGSAAAVCGLAFLLRGTSPSRRRAALLLALSLLYVDGILHWLAVAEHVGSVPNTAFFLATGAVQVASVPFAIKREGGLWWVGVAFTGFLIQLYAATRIVPPPFELQPEPPEALGLLSKGVESVLLVALGFFFGRRVIPSAVREAVARIPPVSMFLLGAVATGSTIGLEAIWGLLPPFVILAATISLILLILLATSAYARRAGSPSRSTWAVAAVLFVGHITYGAYYAWIPLPGPLLLCVVSALVLGIALVMSAWGGASTRTSLPG